MTIEISRHSFQFIERYGPIPIAIRDALMLMFDRGESANYLEALEVLRPILRGEPHPESLVWSLRFIDAYGRTFHDLYDEREKLLEAGDESAELRLREAIAGCILFARAMIRAGIREVTARN